MKVNFKEAVAKGLNGEPFKIQLDGEETDVDMARAMGDIIYNQSSSIAMGRLAQDIYDGKEVELTLAELAFFSALIASEDCLNILPVKFGLMKFIEAIVNKETEKK